MKAFIVWNEDKTEGFVTTDEALAYEVRKSASTNCTRSDVAVAFCKQWWTDNCTEEEIEVEDHIPSHSEAEALKQRRAEEWRDALNGYAEDPEEELNLSEEDDLGDSETDIEPLGRPLPDRWTKETPTEEHIEDLRDLDYNAVTEKAKELCRGACFTAFFKHDKESEPEWSLEFHGPSMREFGGTMTPFTKVTAWVNEEVYNQIKSDHNNLKFYGVEITSV